MLCLCGGGHETRPSSCTPRPMQPYLLFAARPPAAPSLCRLPSFHILFSHPAVASDAELQEVEEEPQPHDRDGTMCRRQWSQLGVESPPVLRWLVLRSVYIAAQAPARLAAAASFSVTPPPASLARLQPTQKSEPTPASARPGSWQQWRLPSSTACSTASARQRRQAASAARLPAGAWRRTGRAGRWSIASTTKRS